MKCDYIIVAEDDSDDQDFIRAALVASNFPLRSCFVNDGHELLAELAKERGCKPPLVLLDLNMPRVGGQRALKCIKNDDKLSGVKVVILTTSAAEWDRVTCNQLGADGYIVKPDDYGDWVNIMRGISATFLS